LDKISECGIESLTETEKQLLDEYAKRWKPGQECVRNQPRRDSILFEGTQSY
jgi:hypothetical protein